VARPAVLLALLLAGCAADSGGPSGDAPADAALGTLRGLVVDAAIRPLAGADVTVQPGGLNATTGDDGAFAFAGLAPSEYRVSVERKGYIGATATARVEAGDAGAPVQFVLEALPDTVRYVDLYKFDGLFECGVWPTNGCANANILTGIVFCSLDLPCFNATGDRSVELHPIDGVPTFLQSEMVWEPTTETGRAMIFGIGHATRQELQDGEASADNFTEGESPLHLTINETVLLESSIGGDRMLLIQASVSVSEAFQSPACPPGLGPPCGVGVSFQQPYTTYTHAFYGYAPPPGWRFTDGAPAPPPE
jgi:hypothetical protein